MKCVHTAAIAAASLALLGTPPVLAQTMLGGGKVATSFPITISQPGSYKLAANLTMPNGSTSAIYVTAHDVTIDLNGFTISGPNVCSTQTKTCIVAGSSSGVITAPVYNLTVRNGTVRGFAGLGISASDGLRVEGVTVAHNGHGGIAANKGAILDRVIAMHNGIASFQSPVAISVADGIISNSAALYNLGHGFKGGQLMASSSMSNGGYGFWAGAGYATATQSRFGLNAGGDFFGNVHSFGNNFCGGQAC
jgi:hypothetical protein